MFESCKQQQSDSIPRFPPMKHHTSREGSSSSLSHMAIMLLSSSSPLYLWLSMRHESCAKWCEDTRALCCVHETHEARMVFVSFTIIPCDDDESNAWRIIYFPQSHCLPSFCVFYDRMHCLLCSWHVSDIKRMIYHGVVPCCWFVGISWSPSLKCCSTTDSTILHTYNT